MIHDKFCTVKVTGGRWMPVDPANQHGPLRWEETYSDCVCHVIEAVRADQDTISREQAAQRVRRLHGIDHNCFDEGQCEVLHRAEAAARGEDTTDADS